MENSWLCFKLSWQTLGGIWADVHIHLGVQSVLKAQYFLFQAAILIHPTVLPVCVFVWCQVRYLFLVPADVHVLPPDHSSQGNFVLVWLFNFAKGWLHVTHPLCYLATLSFALLGKVLRYLSTFEISTHPNKTQVKAILLVALKSLKEDICLSVSFQKQCPQLLRTIHRHYCWHHWVYFFTREAVPARCMDSAV